MELRGVGRDRQGGLYSAFCIQSVHLLLGNRTLNSDLIVLQDAVSCADLIGGAINNTVVDRIGNTIELRPAVSDNILKVGIEVFGLVQLQKQVALFGARQDSRLGVLADGVARNHFVLPAGGFFQLDLDVAGGKGIRYHIRLRGQPCQRTCYNATDQ